MKLFRVARHHKMTEEAVQQHPNAMAKEIPFNLPFPCALFQGKNAFKMPLAFGLFCIFHPSRLSRCVFRPLSRLKTNTGQRPFPAFLVLPLAGLQTRFPTFSCQPSLKKAQENSRTSPLHRSTVLEAGFLSIELSNDLEKRAILRISPSCAAYAISRQSGANSPYATQFLLLPICRCTLLFFHSLFPCK